MRDPLDLTQLFGEGWCVTVVDFNPEDVLDMMGVDNAVALTDGVHLASQRLTSRHQDVLLLAKQLLTDATLVLELEDTTGWVGRNQAVLADLSEAGGTACTISKDPNNVTVGFPAGTPMSLRTRLSCSVPRSGPRWPCSSSPGWS